jgi:ElaB/YqjD/DUF883 family membrane-anchored ribosome-binding protein
MNRPNADDSQQQPPRGQERAQAQGGRRADAGSSADSSAAARRPMEIDRLREAGRNLGSQIDEQVRKRPYVMLGAAAGFGFVAGAVLGSRLGQVLLAAGVGYAAKRVLGGDFGIERIQAEIEKLAGEAERRSGRA